MHTRTRSSVFAFQPSIVVLHVDDTYFSREIAIPRCWSAKFWRKRAEELERYDGKMNRCVA